MNLKQSAMASVIGGALAILSSSPASALPTPIAIALPTLPVAADPAVKTTEEKLADAQKEIRRLAELLDGRKDTDGRPSPVDVGAVEEIKRLKDKLFVQGETIAALKTQIEEMKKSTSLKPAPAPAPAAALTGKGTVRVINDYAVEIALVVNNSSYRVAPNMTVDIPVPVGDFTYQLLNSGSSLTPVKSPIAEKEVVKLRIK